MLAWLVTLLAAEMPEPVGVPYVEPRVLKWTDWFCRCGARHAEYRRACDRCGRRRKK